jgi:hypothetical protein
MKEDIMSVEMEEAPPATDPEGEIIYDPNAARPDYKLFTLRENSCLDYYSMIDLGKQKEDDPD